MSAAPPAHDHGGHDDHAFTGEPIQVLPADEPRTPGWLTLLGAALFTLLAVYILVTHGAPAAGAADQAAQPAAAQPAAAQPAAQHAAAPPEGTAPRFTPEPLQELQKKIQEARAKGLLPDTKQGH